MDTANSPGPDSLDQLFHAARGRMDASVGRPVVRARLIGELGDDGLAPGLPAIDRYEIQGWLGSGGMGRVYRAWDRQLERPVALKLLEASERRPVTAPDTVVDTARQTVTREMGLEEAYALARIAHPNVVRVYDVGRYLGRVYLVMELIEGETLSTRLQRGPVRVDALLAIFAQIAAGLAAMHERGLVHRDVKPQNILLSSTQIARVIDLGLARRFQSGDLCTDKEPRQLSSSDGPYIDLGTRSPAAEGTPAYMSPQQWLGGNADWRSDDYSLALCLYDAIFGSARAVHIRPTSPLPARGRDGKRIPADVQKLLETALDCVPSRRFAQPGNLARALASIVEVTQRRRKSRSRTLAAVVGAPIVAFGVQVASHTSPTDLGEPTPARMRASSALHQRVDALLGPLNLAHLEDMFEAHLLNRMPPAEWVDWLTVLRRSRCTKPDELTVVRRDQWWVLDLPCRDRRLELWLKLSDAPLHKIRELSLLSRPTTAELAIARDRIQSMLDHADRISPEQFDTSASDRLFFIRIGDEFDRLRRGAGRCALGELERREAASEYQFELSCSRAAWRGSVTFGFGDPTQPGSHEPPLRELSFRPGWQEDRPTSWRSNWVPMGRTDHRQH